MIDDLLARGVRITDLHPPSPKLRENLGLATLLVDLEIPKITRIRAEQLETAFPTTEPLDATAGMAKGKTLVVPGDVGKPDDVKKIFAETKREFGRLDLLFNNAGMGAPPINLEDLTYEQW